MCLSSPSVYISHLNPLAFYSKEGSAEIISYDAETVAAIQKAKKPGGIAT